jgi:hypothetical protein
MRVLCGIISWSLVLFCLPITVWIDSLPAIIFSAFRGHLEVLRLLLDKGAIMDATAMNNVSIHRPPDLSAAQKYMLL